ncbi:SEL1-like repeat protein [Sulfurovum sp. TSL1]|uniref:SEL1-like repeat protein n=1 Tax=Sulfurovum sp. TSL1 TaxID=2826994 RepID=UPI001CC46257|nr:SEL1-like repeat protein [Sulfurovum sp. TSL1]GIT97573.1 hypothetical protein TSL1_03940 [Sulfurovum sp. TSL1]
MKRILLAGILVLAMGAFAHAESDEFDDDLGEDLTDREIVQDFIDDCNNHGDYYGCFSAAMKYEKGEVLEKDISKAIEYYEKACKLGSKEGCKMAEKLKTK